eukprot:1658713-Lingulodinium_polyedra.AAC.1
MAEYIGDLQLALKVRSVPCTDVHLGAVGYTAFKELVPSGRGREASHNALQAEPIYWGRLQQGVVCEEGRNAVSQPLVPHCAADSSAAWAACGALA